MTRARFLNDLYRLLAGNGMKGEQAEQHLTYYAEMLADRMEEGMAEEQAVASMENVDTIARRILEEEGLAYRPLKEIPMTPPEYPDASRLGGGGGTRAYQVPQKVELEADGPDRPVDVGRRDCAGGRQPVVLDAARQEL